MQNEINYGAPATLRRAISDAINTYIAYECETDIGSQRAWEAAIEYMFGEYGLVDSSLPIAYEVDPKEFYQIQVQIDHKVNVQGTRDEIVRAVWHDGYARACEDTRVSLQADLSLQERHEALARQLEETQRELEQARQRLDDKAPTLRAAVQSVSGGQGRLMSAYQASESRLYARIEAAEKVVEKAKEAVGTVEKPINSYAFVPDPLRAAISAYDALLLEEKRRVHAVCVRLSKEFERDTNG
jgi:predicted glycosyl hydrolase (DUF1957 family)